MAKASRATAVEDVFVGNSEMALLMRSIDWSTTPVGAVANWSQSLITAIRIMLGSRYPMFVWWGQSMTKFYNDAYINILGKRHPQALGSKASVVWAEIWDTLGPQALAVLNEGQSSWNEELLLLMERNGYPEETYFTFSYSPVADDDGGVGGVFCACTEDTQRVLSNRRLRTLRELAAATAGASTLEVACEISVQALASNLYDIPFASLYLLSDSEKRARLVGTTLATLTQPHLQEIEVGETTLSSNRWSLQSVFKSGESQLVDNLASEFSTLPDSAWAEPVSQAIVLPLKSSGQARLTGFLICGISPRRVLDDDYKGFFDLVAGHITTAITNARTYEEERKRAEALAELDRAKTVFFSNVSHEFRTPLTLMLGPLEDALADTDAPMAPVQQERIEVVQRNSQRLLKLVNTLLDFSRIEAGRIEAVYEPTDLAILTAELASVFRSATERAGLHFLVDCPTEGEVAYVDREMWEKIVLNLLSNAFKFTFSGEIAVSLRKINDSFELAVRDTGIGIKAEELPRLFERFHRVTGAQGRSFEGSGIGLSLVQELTKLHGGTVQVTSVLGEGSCFTVSIPTGYTHLPQDRIRDRALTLSTTSRAITYVEEALRWLPQESAECRDTINPYGKTSGLRVCTSAEIKEEKHSALNTQHSSLILLVDDNADMRDYVKRLLSQRYEVETASNGIAALAAIDQRLPDLVLTDVMMPELDGFELLQQLRSSSRTQEIPIILLSARAGEEARVEGLIAGADDYLIKPFSARELLARVEANLKMARLRQKAALREQELRLETVAAKENLETILGSINDAFVTIDQQWRYTYVNDKAASMFSLSKEDFLGKSIWELFPDTVGSLFYTELHRAIAEQTDVHFEYSYPAWNRSFENHVYPSANGVSIFTTEITARKQAELALRQSEMRFRQMAEAIEDVFWLAHPESGQLLYVNPAYEKIWGRSCESLYANRNSWIEAIHPQDRDKAQAAVAKCMSDGSAVVEYRVVRSDGSEAWVRDRGFVIEDALSQSYQLAGIAEDITERKRAETEREQLLTREKAARELAETANRIKDEFLAVLSHELRSPLNPILGWVKLLRGGKLDANKTAMALETIERNAKLQTQLIEDLLDVSRILRGKLILNVNPVHLEEIITAAVETVRLAAEAKQIQIETVFDSTIPKVLGDPNRLQQVVWNLLTNAVKFTPAGGRVEIKLERAHSFAQITVSDTGKGIDPEFLPYVFESFRQADSSTTRNFGGLGLGLAIVRSLVELHGGTVHASSSGEGQGATFKVQLPLMSVERAVNQSSEQGTPSKDLSSLRILVVDDETDARELIVFILEHYGAKVTAVASAGEALTILSQMELDLIVSDIGMPQIDGYMFLRLVRSMPPQQNGQIPVIAVTAYAGDFNQQQAKDAGFQNHISKPIEPTVLVTAVASLFDGKNNYS